ncbi:UDP-N-acetylglucosamine pyrophosphorylase [Sorochytrium milnesiophthora]
MASESDIRKAYTAAGQEQVFTFFDALSQHEKSAFLAQLAPVDPDRVNRIYKKAMEASQIDPLTAKIEPLPADVFVSTRNVAKDKLRAWHDAGMQAIKDGKVAVLLMAGGQGTRLGSARPKGCYDVGLPSKKSLFQIQAERIRKLQELAGGVMLPWYVMVSGPTRKETEAFFHENGFWGLSKDNVMFFEQGTLPALTTKEGKMFLESKSSLALSPDGNGGVYAALRSQGILSHMQQHKIQYIHAYCVDNCLVRVADPTFLGYNITAGAACGAKTVRKVAPNEQVGVVCMRNGRYGVVEYSEIPSQLAEQTNPDKSLVYGAANIANHFYTLDFLQSVSSFEGDLEYHIAHKKIKHVDLTTGQPVSPSDNNGVKMELFIFDVFPFTKKFAVFEVERQDEFSPLKNAPGGNKGDSPETSRRDTYDQCRRFLEAAGATVVPASSSPDKYDDNACEVSPLVTYEGEGLESLRGKKLKLPLHVEKLADFDQYIVA